MGRPAKKITIKEGVSALKSRLKTVEPYKQTRIQLLLLIKSATVATKKGLAAALGINRNTAQSWRKRYEKGGLDLLLPDNRGGKKPCIIDATTDAAILGKLSSATDPPEVSKGHKNGYP
jgi:transposase-like protein